MIAQAELYQVGKVARILRISRSLTLRLLRQGDLPSVRTEQGLRVESSSLEAWVQGQMEAYSGCVPSLAKEGQKK
jgi:excisionase family DNA binding protein